MKNISTRIYPPGGTVDVIIQLVANHLGTFEFSLCPRNNVEEMGRFNSKATMMFSSGKCPLIDNMLAETEECFIPLKVNGSEVYRLNTHRKGSFPLPVQLPKDISCEKCILRWHWKSGK